MIFELILIYILLVQKNLLCSVSGVNAILPYGDFNFALLGITLVFMINVRPHLVNLLNKGLHRRCFALHTPYTGGPNPVAKP